MKILFDAKSVNEGLARMLVSAFMVDMNPTLEQLSDVKTAVSEAVTNAIIHGYGCGVDSDDDPGECDAYDNPEVTLCCDRDGCQLIVTVEDEGAGIEDIGLAMQPFYTSRPEWERTGMGFSFMEAFMDRIEVRSAPGEGTRVAMWKYIEGEQ
jgi:stage II sporulation protein AB (anti-sigma F factor)